MLDIVQPTSAVGTHPQREALANELKRVAFRHRFRGTFNSSLHQLLIIAAAFGAFAAPACAAIRPDKAVIAGVVGGIPGLCAILITRLHCVKSSNWHLRVAQKASDLRRRLLYELADPATVSAEYRALNEQMLTLWESTTATDEDTALAFDLKPTKSS